jgi:hypothetical protein
MTKSKKSKLKVPESAIARTKMSYRSSRHRAAKLGMPFGFENFEDFHQYMGDRPSAKHTLDRIDNAKGYVRENLRWATKAEQAQNRHTTIKISYQGKTQTAWEFAQLLGCSVDFVYSGLRRGESPEQIAFHARDAKASKTVAEPWPWPVGDEDVWERSYAAYGKRGEGRLSFLRRICSERYAALMKMMFRPAGDVEPEVIGIDEETGEPLYKSEPLPPGFHEHLERVKAMLADAELKYAAAARRTTDPFAALFKPKGTP